MIDREHPERGLGGGVVPNDRRAHAVVTAGEGERRAEAVELERGRRRDAAVGEDAPARGQRVLRPLIVDRDRGRDRGERLAVEGGNVERPRVSAEIQDRERRRVDGSAVETEAHDAVALVGPRHREIDAGPVGQALEPPRRDRERDARAGRVDDHAARRARIRHRLEGHEAAVPRRAVHAVERGVGRPDVELRVLDHLVLRDVEGVDHDGVQGDEELTDIGVVRDRRGVHGHADLSVLDALLRVDRRHPEHPLRSAPEHQAVAAAGRAGCAGDARAARAVGGADDEWRVRARSAVTVERERLQRGAAARRALDPEGEEAVVAPGHEGPRACHRHLPHRREVERKVDDGTRPVGLDRDAAWIVARRRASAPHDGERRYRKREWPPAEHGVILTRPVSRASPNSAAGQGLASLTKRCSGPGGV